MLEEVSALVAFEISEGTLCSHSPSVYHGHQSCFSQTHLHLMSSFPLKIQVHHEAWHTSPFNFCIKLNLTSMLLQPSSHYTTPDLRRSRAYITLKSTQILLILL